LIDSYLLLGMEHVISMEEILGPFWELLPPPAPEPEPEREQPPVTGIVVGSVIDVAAAGHGHGGGDMMDQQHATEWTFERLLEEEALTTSTPPPVVVVPNSCCSGALNVDRPPVMEEAVMMAPAAVSSAVVGDPMEYNAILRRKLEEDLEAFKMWRVYTLLALLPYLYYSLAISSAVYSSFISYFTLHCCINSTKQCFTRPVLYSLWATGFVVVRVSY
jgi:hypothetical protein